MRKVFLPLLVFLAVTAIVISCSKSVPAPITYSVVGNNDSSLDNVYITQGGTATMNIKVKYLAGYNEDNVTLKLSGLPDSISVTPDSFTAAPTYIETFTFTAKQIAQGTYPVTLTSYTSTGGYQVGHFNVIVISPNCATSLLGNLNGSNSCTARSYTYTSTASATSSANSLTINNFGGYGTGVNVTVTLNCINNTLTIPSADYGNGTILSGSGTFTTTGMVINYSATHTPGGFAESCTATYTK